MDLSSDDKVEDEGVYKNIEKVFDQEKIVLNEIDEVRSSHISDSNVSNE